LHWGGYCPTCAAQLNADGSSVSAAHKMRDILFKLGSDLGTDVQERVRRLVITLGGDDLPTADEARGTFDPSAPRIEDEIQALAAQVPPEQWDRVPEDLSEQHDHYIYGTPREDDGTPAEDLQPSRFLSVIPEEFCEVIYHPDEEDDCSDGEDGGYDGD